MTKVKYKDGKFIPLEKIKGIKEGEEIEISLKKHPEIIIPGDSFEFLKYEPDLYSEEDIIEK